MGGLVQRYGSIFRSSWARRHEAETPARLAHEMEFLPAHLELIDTPPHPAPLWTARLIMGAATAIMLVAFFGRLDVVAVAPGQLIPSANVKLIQTAVTGVVEHIRVQNGERVTAGELLLDLDPAQATADADKALTNKLDAQLAIARAHALLIAQEKAVDPHVEPVLGAPPSRQADNQSLAEGAFREYSEKLSSLKAELHRRAAQLATTQEEISKLEQTAPIARKQADDYKSLSRDKYVSLHNYLDKEKLAIEQEHALTVEASHLTELAAAIDEQRQDIATTIATFRREQWELLNRSEQEAAQNQNDETKADARERLTQLKSPVNGVVQQLNVHTVGGVVTSAQTLMEIVPDDTLEVEARVSNKDIGFVNPGQTAIVKISTFPYTRFGYLTGTVIKISNDATADRKLGLVFLARIRIPSNRFRVQSKWLNLSPGMEVIAEIKTGHQKVWQYFLSPLIETGRESLRER
jgi:hemolysin D